MSRGSTVSSPDRFEMGESSDIRPVQRSLADAEQVQQDEAWQTALGGEGGRTGIFGHLARRLLRAAGNPPVAIVLWNGERLAPPNVPLAGSITIADRGTLFRLLLDPDWQFGEAFTQGRLHVEGDLVEVLVAVDRALLAVRRPNVWQRLAARIAAPGASLARARSNTQKHYDLGNEFYRLWLDEQLAYTCAYFSQPALTLEDAQVAKFDHVCRKLQLRAGQSVVEAGCGWGGLALHMARHYGVTVTAYNVSREQVKYARARATQERLDDRVEFVEDDWRRIRGQYDAFVSVGMLEHVGPKNYRQLGDVIDACLKREGRGLIHSIGRNAVRGLDSWTRRRIFPGAHVPSLVEMGPIFEPHEFSILDVENLRLHYAATLRHWLARYEKSVAEVARMFDESFVRMWRLYLAASVAAFETGWLQLFQIVFARPDDNAIPWTREHLYSRHDDTSPSREFRSTS